MEYSTFHLTCCVGNKEYTLAFSFITNYLPKSEVRFQRTKSSTVTVIFVLSDVFTIEECLVVTESDRIKKLNMWFFSFLFYKCHVTVSFVFPLMFHFSLCKPHYNLQGVKKEACKYFSLKKFNSMPSLDFETETH